MRRRFITLVYYVGMACVVRLLIIGEWLSLCIFVVLTLAWFGLAHLLGIDPYLGKD